MRWIQNAAMFGLIVGSLLLAYGISANSSLFAFLGLGLGLLVGVPAAYTHFIMEGYALDLRTLRIVRVELPKSSPRQLPNLKLMQFYVKHRVATATTKAKETIFPPMEKSVPPESDVEVVHPKQVAPPFEGESREIPVRVIETPPPPPEPAVVHVPVSIEEEIQAHQPPPLPQKTGMSSAERQALIDQLNEASATDDILPYASHEDTLVRLYAVQRLGNLGDGNVEPELRVALDDPEDIVQRAARLALHKLDLEV